MWLAIFWGFVIGAAAHTDTSGGSAAVISFLVIIYFVHKSEKAEVEIRKLKKIAEEREWERNALLQGVRPTDNNYPRTTT